MTTSTLNPNHNSPTETDKRREQKVKSNIAAFHRARKRLINETSVALRKRLAKETLNLAAQSVGNDVSRFFEFLSDAGFILNHWNNESPERLLPQILPDINVRYEFTKEDALRYFLKNKDDFQNRVEIQKNTASRIVNENEKRMYENEFLYEKSKASKRLNLPNSMTRTLLKSPDAKEFQ